MTEPCRRASAVDLAAFVEEPRDPEFKDFRRHYPACDQCSSEVARWTKLDSLVHQALGTVREKHPEVEQLALFQRSPEQLSEVVRDTIRHHLTECHACTGELSFAKSFDFSLLAEPGEVNEFAIVKHPVRLTSRANQWLSTVWESVLAFFDSLGMLFAKPAFAYAVAAVLCIPAYRYLQLSSELDQTRSVDTGRGTIGPLSPGAPVGPPAGVAGVSSGPAAAALALIGQYQLAYQARDVDALARVWAITPENREELAHSFADARALSVLTDVQRIEVVEQGKRVKVEFAQVTTRLDGDEFKAVGPVFYSADIRRVESSDRWVIHRLAERTERPD